jgi:signal transduction histidine kinase
VFSFKILPPIWKTWWAYVFYALILALMIFAVDRFQRRRLVKKERERAEIRETKLRVQAAEAENKMLHLESERKELELLKATELKTAYTELQKMHENLKATQEQLVTQQKLASLGALTAGIAHEIKNPLNFVKNFSEISRELLDEIKTEIQKGNRDNINEVIDNLMQNLEKINQHGNRADSIVKGMLLHSRGTSGEKTLTDINDLLDQDVNLAYHGMRATNKEFNITIEKDYDKTLEKINVVPQDISRVFLNIINNACYAAYDRKKKGSDNNFIPTLGVSTKNLGGKVEIKIGDNGNGIPENILDKIFQPFFTTKPTGEGTGLGLSLSYDVVTKVHGGELKVETKESEGTEFIITLPKQNEA